MFLGDVRLGGISQELVLGNGSECSIDEPVPVHLPVSLVGNNRIVPDFSQLKKAVPELTDAFTSPHGDTTIVIAGSRMLVFDVSEGRLGAKLLDVDFPAGTTPVMEQWALGVHVKTWTQQVQQWKIQPASVPSCLCRYWAEKVDAHGKASRINGQGGIQTNCSETLGLRTRPHFEC